MNSGSGSPAPRSTGARWWTRVAVPAGEPSRPRARDRGRYPGTMSLLTAGQRRAWDEDGWCVLERAVPAELLARAQRAVAKLFPTAEQMARAPGEP